VRARYTARPQAGGATQRAHLRAVARRLLCSGSAFTEVLVSWVVQVVIAALLGGLAFLVVAHIVPGFRIRGGFPTAVGIAAVFALLKALLQGVLILLTLPLVLLTLGLFIVVINAFLLWLTDKLVRRFTVVGAGPMIVGSLLLSLIDIVMSLAIRGGALY
jgi:putative membrane protein